MRQVYYVEEAQVDVCKFYERCKLQRYLDAIVFFKAEDGIRDLVRSRGLGDVYKRQDVPEGQGQAAVLRIGPQQAADTDVGLVALRSGEGCLLYTSDAADDQLCVDLRGRRIIKKNNTQQREIDASQLVLVRSDAASLSQRRSSNMVHFTP